MHDKEGHSYICTSKRLDQSLYFVIHLVCSSIIVIFVLSFVYLSFFIRFALFSKEGKEKRKLKRKDREHDVSDATGLWNGH